MLPDELKGFLLRDLAGAQRELDLYPDEASVWREVPGLPNPGGTLMLHLAGGIQHHFGRTLAHTAYVRDREAEFSRRDVPREELRQELERAKRAVEAAFSQLTGAQLDEPFPGRIGDAELSIRHTIMQLVTHTAYHLGQLDYHRRMVTGSTASADTLAAPQSPQG